MKYNPDRHHRRSLRLRHYDYRRAGWYFVTICTYQRQCLFGAIAESQIQLNEYGQIVANCWQSIPSHFPQAQIEEFVVMPNHVHGLLVITDSIPNSSGRDMAMPCPYEMQRPGEVLRPQPPKSSSVQRKFGQPVPGSLSTMVGSFKSAATKRINQLRNAPGTPVWQGRFYDHIVRNEESLKRIQQYIRNNPVSWQDDQLHPQNPSKW